MQHQSWNKVQGSWWSIWSLKLFFPFISLCISVEILRHPGPGFPKGAVKKATRLSWFFLFVYTVSTSLIYYILFLFVLGFLDNLCTFSSKCSQAPFSPVCWGVQFCNKNWSIYTFSRLCKLSDIFKSVTFNTIWFQLCSPKHTKTTSRNSILFHLHNADI